MYDVGTGDARAESIELVTVERDGATNAAISENMVDPLEGDGSAQEHVDEVFLDDIQPGAVATPATAQVKTFIKKTFRIPLDESVELVVFEQGEASNAENLKIDPDPLGDGDGQPEYLDDEYQVEFQGVQANEAAAPVTPKVETFNMEAIHTSLNISSNSDCMVTCEYIAVYEGADNKEEVNKTHE